MTIGAPPRALGHGELRQLRRLNTPTISNGWDRVTRHDVAAAGFNVEETRDFMPRLGPMVGYAVTVVCEPSNPKHPRRSPSAWDENECRALLAAARGAEGQAPSEILEGLADVAARFTIDATARFAKRRER